MKIDFLVSEMATPSTIKVSSVTIVGTVVIFSVYHFSLCSLSAVLHICIAFFYLHFCDEKFLVLRDGMCNVLMSSVMAFVFSFLIRPFLILFPVSIVKAGEAKIIFREILRPQMKRFQNNDNLKTVTNL